MKYDTSIRLTDSLERELIARAIEDQMHFKPVQAIKDIIASISAKVRKNQHSMVADNTQAQAAG